MRVAIISVYVDFLRRGRKSRGVLQPGIGPLIAGLLPRDIEIEVINETVDSIDWSRRYDLVFISCLHSDFDRARQISHYFRCRGAKTVLGNIMASTYPELCTPYFDAIAIGDAEGIVPQVWDDFCRGGLRQYYVASEYQEIGDRIPRFDLVADSVIFPLAFEATKGCPWHCNFCVLTGMGTRFKTRAISYIIQSILNGQAVLSGFALRRIVQRSFVSFLDNNLGGNQTYLQQFANKVTDLNVFWGAAMTFNALLKEGVVEVLADAGCCALFVGLETFNREALLDMGKPQNDLDQVRRVIVSCRSRGVLFSSGLILDPLVDSWSYIRTIPEKLREVGLHTPTFIGFESPIPGTPFFDALAREPEPAFLPNVLLRDITGYTLVVRPKKESVSEHIAGYKWLLDNVYTRKTIYRKLLCDIPALIKGGGMRGLTVALGELIFFMRKRPAQRADSQRTYCAGTDIIPPEMNNIPFSSSDFGSEEEQRKICDPWRVTDHRGRVLPQWLESKRLFLKNEKVDSTIV